MAIILPTASAKNIHHMETAVYLNHGSNSVGSGRKLLKISFRLLINDDLIKSLYLCEQVKTIALFPPPPVNY